MTQTHAPEVSETTIVISNSRKDLLAAAMNDARNVFETTARTHWEAYVETPAQRRANARAQRIAWLVETL